MLKQRDRRNRSVESAAAAAGDLTRAPGAARPVHRGSTSPAYLAAGSVRLPQAVQAVERHDWLVPVERT
jgi:hypothetical protein